MGEPIAIKLATEPTSEATTTKPAEPAALMSIPQVAAMLDVSVATIERMDSRGRLPAAIRLSAGCKRWRRAELLEWVAAGCPDRKAWDAARKRR